MHVALDMHMRLSPPHGNRGMVMSLSKPLLPEWLRLPMLAR